MSFIWDYSPTIAMSRSDRFLIQQGSRNQPYSYATPGQLFGLLSQADITGALGFTPMNAGGGTISGALTMPGLTVNGIATVGSLSVTQSQTANTIFAGPSGISGVPTFRSLTGADLPVPTLSTLGGVQSIAGVSHQFLTSIDTNGVPHLAQPSAADVSGLVASATTDTTNASNISSGTLPAARLPAPTLLALGGVQSVAQVSHQWVTSIDTSGVPHLAQPAAADISGLAASATTDTTNAANISSGTLPNARLPTPGPTSLGGVQSVTPSASTWIRYIDTSGVPHLTQPTAGDVSGLGALATLNIGSGLSSGAGSLSANVISVFGRTGTVTLESSDVTGALSYTPLNKAGDTMSGLLTLSADPTASLHATTKQYADTKLAASGGAMSGTFSGNPAFSGSPTFGNTLQFVNALAYPAGAFPTSSIRLYSNNSLSGTGVTTQAYAHRFLANSEQVQFTGGGTTGIRFMDIAHNFGGGATQGWRTSLAVTQTMTGATTNLSAGINPINVSLVVNQAVQVNDGGTGLQPAIRLGASTSPQNNSTAVGIQALLTGAATFQSGQLGMEIDVGGQPGYSVWTKKGLMICKWSTDNFQSPMDDCAFMVCDQGGASVGWTTGIRFGSSAAQWPIDPTNGSIIGAAYSTSSVVAGARYGIDFKDVGFAAFNTTKRGGFLNSNNFAVDGVGAVMLGSTYLTPSSTGLAVDAKGIICTGATLVSGGTNWQTGDIAYDPYGGVWRVNGATAGVVTSLVPLPDSFGNHHLGNYPSSTPPTNPITLTPWDVANQTSAGLTVNLTWNTTATVLSLQPSGGSTAIGASSNTGTGTFSLVHGIQATDNGRKGSRGFSSGARAAVGDVLISEMTLHAQTTSATPVVATSDGQTAGTANQFTLANFTCGRLVIRVVARDQNGANFASWRLEGCLAKRGNGAASTAVTNTTFTQDASIGTVTGWSVAISADTTNGAVQVSCTGNTDTIDWAIDVHSIEVS